MFDEIRKALGLDGQKGTFKKLFTLDPAKIAEYESFSVRERQISQRFADLKLDSQALDTDRKLWWRGVERQNNLTGEDLRYVNGEVHKFVPEETGRE